MNHRDVDWNNIEQAREYVTEWANRTFPGRTPGQALSKLVLHEIPETLMAIKEGKPTSEMELEFADLLILILDLGSLWGINIPRGLARKMEINEHRMWLRDVDGIAQHVVPVMNVDQKGYDK